MYAPLLLPSSSALGNSRNSMLGCPLQPGSVLVKGKGTDCWIVVENLYVFLYCCLPVFAQDHVLGIDHSLVSPSLVTPPEDALKER